MNIPIVGEVWSATTALFIVAAGLIPLVTSKYSDEEIDLVNGLILINGIMSALSHSTLSRIFGQADALSINIAAAVYMKSIIATYDPTFVTSPMR